MIKPIRKTPPVKNQIVPRYCSRVSVSQPRPRRGRVEQVFLNSRWLERSYLRQLG
jgi:hypothetical protein